MVNMYYSDIFLNLHGHNIMVVQELATLTNLMLPYVH